MTNHNIIKAHEINSEASPACLAPWIENPYRLVNLWNMLRLYAEHFVNAYTLIGQAIAELEYNIRPHQDTMAALGQHIGILLTFCDELGLRYSRVHLNRLDRGGDLSRLLPWLKELHSRMCDELSQRIFVQINPHDAELYTSQVGKEWARIAERFKCDVDIEEAKKCIALERYTAAVFHLMRIVEAAVLKLQMFLDKEDPKAHFGSVLSKLEHLHTKTRFEDLPTHLQPYRQFLIDVLGQLHAVKDSWRNRVSHVDGKIIPTDLFSGELAMGVYSATLLLMEKMVDGLPETA